MPSTAATSPTTNTTMSSVVHHHHTETSTLLPSKATPVSYDKPSSQHHRQPSNISSSSSSSLPSRIHDVLLSPLRELCYLFLVFRQSMQVPTWPQVVSGMATKGPVFVFSLTAWSVLLLPSHILPFTCVAFLSFLLESFHGMFVASWLNVQCHLENDRGVPYQVIFNLLYMQSTGALFRLCAWAALPESTIPPWSLTYWRDVSLVTLIGTFFGVLGYNGINNLHRKGILSDNFRAYVQHMRDVFMLVNGVYFSAGRMTMYWSIFAIQQAVDAMLYVMARKVDARPGSPAELESGEGRADGEEDDDEEEEEGGRAVKDALQAAVAPFAAVGSAVRRIFVRMVGKDNERDNSDNSGGAAGVNRTEFVV